MAALERELEAALPDTDVHVLAEWGTDNSTIHSATRFLDWDTDGQQASMLRFLAEQPPEVQDNPTLTLWLHNEFDQQSGDFTAADWEREVRADAALVRAELGQGAETTPYAFVPIRYPYGGNFGPIGDGMAVLDADASFNASVSSAALGLAMDGDGYANSSHMGDADAVALGKALAAELADDARAALAAAGAPDDGGGEPAPAPQPPNGGGGSPSAPAGLTTVFADDFENGYLRENWGDAFHGSDYGGKGVWGWDASQVNVVQEDGDGALEVSMTRQDNGYWLGGGLNSFKAGKDITYGRIEFDAKVEEGQGTMGVILTWPTSDVWPRDGEIDIFEGPGTETMHTLHWQGDNGADWYDVKRGDFYDETKWNRYEVNWTPDKLTIDVTTEAGEEIRVAEWTDPAMIPDVAHGIGAMGNVAGPNDQWMGGPPDGSTPQKVSVYLDNMVMSQWDGVTDIHSGTPGPAPQPDPQPEPQPDPTTPPPQPGGPLSGGEGPDHLQLWVSGDAYQGDAKFVVKVDGAQVGGEFTATHKHGVSAQQVDLRGDWGPGAHSVAVVFLNDKWDGTAATDRNLYVNGALYNGEPIEGAEQAVLDGGWPARFSFTDTAPPEPQPEPEPEPQPEPPAGSDPVSVTGGQGRDTLEISGPFRFRVDGGDGRDTIVLGDGHGASVVVAHAGELRGDVVSGFAAGDVLELHGFGEGASLEALGGGRFKATDSDGHAERFRIVGVETLDETDYVFA